MRKLLVYIMAMALLLTNTNIVALADTVSMNEWTVSENTEENNYEIGSTDGEDVAEVEENVSDNEETVLDNEEAEIDLTKAREALQKLASEQPIMALIYLSDAYEIKAEPDKDSKTVFTAKSGQTVFVEDVACEKGTFWYRVCLVAAGQNDEIIEYVGYVERKHLAYSDERFIAWEKIYLGTLIGTLQLNVGGYQTMSSDYADVAQFPASYHSALNALKKDHPNWTFVKMDTGLDWSTVIYNETNPSDRNLVYYTYPEAWRGAKYDNTWYCATKEAVEYSMDPRNHFGTPSVFQFELLTYNASYHTEGSIQTFLNSTFMSGVIPGDSKTYAKAFIEIGKSGGFSPFHLAARVYQEQGAGTSPLISGTYPGYEGYYNYFNIGASGNTDKAVIESGLQYAKEQGWNTRYKSLSGGAGKLAGGYILKGQDTLYLEKFDVDFTYNGLYWHQYMQNLTAPVTEASSIYKMYNNAGSLGSKFVFKIPVYNNMPSEPAAYPSLSVSISQKEATLNKGETLQLTGTVSPATAQVTKSWSSSNTKVATVDSNGLVTAIGGGSATIKFTAGGKSATCKVTVKVPLEGIQIKENSLELYAGKSKTLTVHMKPDDVTEEIPITWSSSNEAVAIVANGTVTGVGNGAAMITATAVGEKGTFTSQIVVTVEECRITFYDENVEQALEQRIVPYGEAVGTLPQIEEKEDAVFSGWYTKINGEGSKVTEETKVYGSLNVYAHYISTNQSFFVKAVGDQTYTGSAIKPEVEVYDGEHLLVKNVDYTVSYSNNKKVNVTGGKSPTITVKGKGNYTGKQQVTFNIVPKDIEDGDITQNELLYAYTGKAIKPSPTLYRDGKKLKKNADYIISYPETGDAAYKNFGTYKILVQGVNGYTGTKEVYMTISRKALLSKVSVKKIASEEYTGSDIVLGSKLVLTYKGETLVENKDYTVSYKNNKEIGTATAVVTALDDSGYIGSKEINFKITGISLNKAKIGGITSKVYEGTAITLEDFPEFAYTYQKNAASNIENLVRGKDYEVEYINNEKKGTATVVFTGKGKFSGTVKKKFKITAFKMNENAGNRVAVDESKLIEVSYQKDNNKPKVDVYFTNADGNKVLLAEGTDYALSYQNNKVVTTSGTENKPVIIIKGKGNFSGTLGKEIPFTILGTDLEKASVGVNANVKATAADILYKEGKTEYKPTVTIYDGKKKLKAGTDFEVVSYTSTNVTEYKDTSENLRANEYKVTVKGLNNYSGTIEIPYRLYETKISKAKFQKVVAQTFDYVGEEGFRPVPEGTYQDVLLELGKDFTVSYENNTKAGTAKVIIEGIGDFGGSKKISFKINKRLLESSQK